MWNIPYVRWPTFVLRYLRAVRRPGPAGPLHDRIDRAHRVRHPDLPRDGSRVLLLVGSLAVNFVLILIAFMVMTAGAAPVA